MPDGQSEYLIKITGDAAGIAAASEQGAAALHKMGEAGQEAEETVDKSTERVNISHREMHLALAACRT